MDTDIELVINTVLANVTVEVGGTPELVIDLMFTTKRRGQAESTPTSRFRLRKGQALDLQTSLAQAIQNLGNGGTPASPRPPH